MPKPITSCAKCGCQACRCNTQNEVINERSGYIEHNSHAAEDVLIEENAQLKKRIADLEQTGGTVSKDDVLKKLKQCNLGNMNWDNEDYEQGLVDGNKAAIKTIEAMPCSDDKLLEALESVLPLLDHCAGEGISFDDFGEMESATKVIDALAGYYNLTEEEILMKYGKDKGARGCILER